MAMTNLRKSRALYKFVVYQTKGLVSNNRGKPVLMDSFDHVIYDLYGVKHFSRKIADYYDDRDIMDLIDRIGLTQLVRLMKNTRYCNVVRELIQIDDDTDSLAKEIRKMRRKGKSNKHMLREFNDLKKLYEKGIKSLRRRLGIRDARTAYKRRYMAVRDLVSGGSYDDDDYFSGLSNVRYRGRDYDPYDHQSFYDDDDDYYNDPYDDRDYSDDYDEDSSELEDFERMMNGPSDRRRQRRVNRPPRRDDDEYYDDPYDHGDDYDDMTEYEEYHRNKDFRDNGRRYNSEDRVDMLSDRVAELADCVQALTSQSRYDQVNHRDPVTHYPERKFAQEYVPPQQYSGVSPIAKDPMLAQLVGEIGSLKEATGYLIDGFKDMKKWQSEMNDMLYELSLEDSEEMEVEMGAPVIDGQSYAESLMNAHPDVHSTDAEDLPGGEDDIPPMPPKPVKKDPDSMSREELIDEVNRTQAQKVNWSQNKDKKPQTTAREQKPQQKQGDQKPAQSGDSKESGEKNS